MPGRPTHLNQLWDVNPAGLTDGLGPVWDGTSKKFKMGTSGTALTWQHDRFVAAASPVATYALSYLPFGINALAKNGGMLAEGFDYTVNYSSGIITLATVPTTGDVIAVSYVTNGSLIALPSGGLIFWWRAGDLGLANGTAVSTWTDATANHWTATQSSAGAKPIYRAAPTGFNGQPAVEFTAASAQNVQAPFNAALNPAALTLFVVFRPKNATTSMGLVSSHEQAAGTSGYAFVMASSPAGTVEALFRSGGGLNADVAGTIGVANTTHWAAVTTTGSGTNALGYLDGTVHGAAVLGNLTPNTTDPFIIGDDPNFGSDHPFDGWIAEVIGYNRVLTGTERAQADAYIQAKYGL